MGLLLEGTPEGGWENKKNLWPQQSYPTPHETAHSRPF